MSALKVFQETRLLSPQKPLQLCFNRFILFFLFILFSDPTYPHLPREALWKLSRSLSDFPGPRPPLGPRPSQACTTTAPGITGLSGHSTLMSCRIKAALDWVPVSRPSKGEIMPSVPSLPLGGCCGRSWNMFHVNYHEPLSSIFHSSIAILGY